MYEQGKFLEAYHYVKKAIDLSPENGFYWLIMAETEQALGNEVSAEEAYENAINFDNENPEVWIKWSLKHFESGNFLKAADIAKEGIDHLPEEPDLYYYTCAYMILSGNYNEAFIYLETGLTLDYDKHILLFEFFPKLETQKALHKIIEQYRK